MTTIGSIKADSTAVTMMSMLQMKVRLSIILKYYNLEKE